MLIENRVGGDYDAINVGASYRPSDCTPTERMGGRLQLYISVWSEPYTVTAKDNYTDSAGKKATIPAGFKVSMKSGETKIDQGLVVQGPDGSEFVWIPVANINDMIIPNGVSAGNHAGQLYTFSNNGATATKDPTTYIANSGYREPDVLTDTTNADGNTTNLSQLGYASTAAMKTALQAEFNSMVASVDYYKGFYVGRYETGDLSKTTVVSKRGNKDIASQTWYTMYQKQKNMYASVSSVTSGMIWGCQWDQMLKIIYASDNTKSLTDSSSWGNYRNATFDYEDNGTKTKALNTNTIIATGSTEYAKAYNIYDVAGNVLDWTLESNNTVNRVLRGRQLRPQWGCFGQLSQLELSDVCDCRQWGEASAICEYVIYINALLLWF